MRNHANTRRAGRMSGSAALPALAMVAALAAACTDVTDLNLTDPMTDDVVETNDILNQEEYTEFKVRIENTSPVYDFFVSRGFTRPWNVFTPGVCLPGHTYAFAFDAWPGARLSFATMLVQSNDLFYAPAPGGIEIWNDDGHLEGDITDMIMLWDAGTEHNQEPGLGSDQPLHQDSANTGAADPNPMVRMADDNGHDNLPDVSDVIRVTIKSLGATTFRVSIENVSDDMTLMTSDGMGHAAALGGGVFVVHGEGDAIFSEGMSDRDEGLEELAEDGDPSMLVESLQMRSGVTSVFAPGAYAVHTMPGAFFMDGEYASEGLEDMAEDGNPSVLVHEVRAARTASMFGDFDVPNGMEESGPLFPGHYYEFMVQAMPGDMLSFVSMFVQSNDIFVAPMDGGINLFPDGMPLNGDVTDMLMYWDAGTELNERPGVGLGQAPRQPGPNTGPREAKHVRELDPYFRYPSLMDVVRVTVTPTMR